MITLVAPTHTRQGASSGFCSMQQSCSWDFPLFSSFFQILDMFWEWLWGDSVGLDRNKQNRVSRELSDSIMWGIKMRTRNGNIYIYRQSEQAVIIIQRRLHYVTLYCALVVTFPPLLRNFCFCMYMSCIQSMLTILRCFWFTSSCTIFSFRPWGGQGEHHKWHQLWATPSCKLVVQFLNSIFDHVNTCSISPNKTELNLQSLTIPLLDLWCRAGCARIWSLGCINAAQREHPRR